VWFDDLDLELTGRMEPRPLTYSQPIDDPINLVQQAAAGGRVELRRALGAGGATRLFLGARGEQVTWLEASPQDEDRLPPEYLTFGPELGAERDVGAAAQAHAIHDQDQAGHGEDAWQRHQAPQQVVVLQGPAERPPLAVVAAFQGVEIDIHRIQDAVGRYPYAETYHVWPGPNSNTFTAFVLRDVPELRVDLPPTAIGKDYLGWSPVAKTPSGTGGQLNLFGLAGVAAGWEEGVELNLLGLTLGLDPKSLAVKLPLIGSLGPRNAPEVITVSGSLPPGS
jgi:hypothetical protein